MFKPLTRLHEIVFYDGLYGEDGCLPLRCGEVLARTWGGTDEFSRSRDFVVWKCAGFAVEHFKHLRSLGLAVIWK